MSEPTAGQIAVAENLPTPVQSYFKGIAPSDPINKIWGFSLAIKDSRFICDAARGDTASVFFIVSMAADLGLTWTHGLRSIYMTPGGKAGLQGDVMLAMLLSRGFKVSFPESTAKLAKCKIIRPKGDMEFEETFSWDDDVIPSGCHLAKGGSSVKDNWKHWPKQMLRWRALANCARIVAADLLGGIYLPDEIDTIQDESGVYVPVQSSGDLKATNDPALKIVEIERVEPETITVESGTPDASTDAAIIEIKTAQPDLSPALKRTEQFLKDHKDSVHGYEPTTTKREPPSGTVEAAAHVVEVWEKKAETDAARALALRESISQRLKGFGHTVTVKQINQMYKGWFEGSLPTTGASAFLEPLQAFLDSLTNETAASLAVSDLKMWGLKLKNSNKQVAEPEPTKTANKPLTLNQEFPGWPSPIIAYAEAVIKKYGWSVKQLKQALLSAYQLDIGDHVETRSTLLLMYFSPDALLLKKKSPGVSMSKIMERIEHANGGMLNLESDAVQAEAAIAKVLSEL